MLSIFCLLLITNGLYAQIYIATNGVDTNPGTFEQPYGTFPKAISESVPGDTIYVRGGIYELTSTITITAVKNGIHQNPNPFMYIKSMARITSVVKTKMTAILGR